MENETTPIVQPPGPGRKPLEDETKAKIFELRRKGFTMEAIAADLKIGLGTVSKYLAGGE